MTPEAVHAPAEVLVEWPVSHILDIDVTPGDVDVFGDAPEL